MSKPRFRFPVFYIALIIIFAILTATVALGQRQLIRILDDYENSLPKYTAEEVFDRYYKIPDVPELFELSGCKLSPAEDKAVLIRYFTALLEGKEITYNGTSASLDGSTYTFSVKADGKKFSSFTLKKNGEKSRYGFATYELDSVENYYVPKESATVTAPKGYNVYANGYALGSEYCTEADAPTRSCEHMPAGVSGIYNNTYQIGGLLYEPEITVRNAAGKNSAVSYDSEKDIYTAALVYDDELKSQYSKYVLDIAKKYAVYMQGDSWFYSIQSYFDKTSAVYESTRTVENYFVIDHSSYSFENEEAQEFYAYDENTFSCRVSFVHLLHKANVEPYRDYIDITFYFRKIDGVYLIYDRFNNN